MTTKENNIRARGIPIQITVKRTGEKIIYDYTKAVNESGILSIHLSAQVFARKGNPFTVLGTWNNRQEVMEVRRLKNPRNIIAVEEVLE